jgi:uncharacterized membrane protein
MRNQVRHKPPLPQLGHRSRMARHKRDTTRPRLRPDSVVITLRIALRNRKSTLLPFHAFRASFEGVSLTGAVFSLRAGGGAMRTDLILALVFGIGIVAGLRSLTAPAAVSWAAHLGSLDLADSSLAFMGSTVAVVVFSVLAIAEYAGDLHPAVPRRTTTGPLIGRIVTGGLCGACLCAAASRSLVPGVVLGGLGAVIGAFAGYEARTRLVAALGVKDRVVALFEDLVAIALAWIIVVSTGGRP